MKRDNDIHEKAVITINLMAANGNLKKEIKFEELYKSLVKMLKGESDENGKKKLMTEEELDEFKKRFGIGD